MDWRIKGAIQKVLGYVPGGARMHYLLQRRGGGLTDFGRECDLKVDDWRLMMGHLRAANMPLAGKTLMEMGTGWYPTFPFCLYLAGATKIYTVDLNPHLKPEMTIALADRLAAHTPLIAKESGRTDTEVDLAQINLVEALRAGKSISDATKGCVQYRAPADASKTELPDSSVDVVFSNSVLEHVPGPVIEACMAEAMRIVKPGGIVFHSVNCGDHYAYADKTIDQLHYLQYSEAQWKKWDNEFLYQNRLRGVDFTRMAKAVGFAIEIDTSHARPERLAKVEAMKIDARFAGYSSEELAITSIDFVGRKR